MKRYANISLSSLALGLVLTILFSLSPAALGAAKKGTLRVSGDNSWVTFINEEKAGEGQDWTAPGIYEFDLKGGFALIAIYVHDAEPAGAGCGGLLADIILDDGTYIGSDKTWRGEAGKTIAERKDSWEKIKFDDKKWANVWQYDPFLQGIWAWANAQLSVKLAKPVPPDPKKTFWVWAGVQGDNCKTDDIYVRYTIGTLAVEPQEKLATAWGKMKIANSQ